MTLYTDLYIHCGNKCFASGEIKSQLGKYNLPKHISRTLHENSPPPPPLIVPFLSRFVLSKIIFKKPENFGKSA